MNPKNAKTLKERQLAALDSILTRAAQIYKELNGTTKKDWDAANDLAIEEAGFKPSSFHRNMKYYANNPQEI